MNIEKLIPFDLLNYYKNSLLLSNLTTYHIGGKCLGVFVLKNHYDYIKLLYYLSNKVPYRIIGKGSNLLINDEEELQFFVITAKYKIIKILKNENKIKVFVTPFTELQFFIKFLIENGISGYEELAGIPATIGGAVFNNAGIKNLEISKYLKKITFFDRKRKKIITINSSENLFSYRTSFFKEESLKKNFFDLISFVFEFPVENTNDPQFLREKYLDSWKRRLNSQPLNEKSCGSVFKNSPEVPAWKVIDNLGYRGYTKGGAKVSEKHTNFIINFNNAKFSDVLSIIQEIKQSALKKGINLEEEVEIWS